LLLGVKVVIAESFERIHRSNLVGMGVLPCRFMDGENAASLGLSGRETFDFEGIGDGGGKILRVTATAEDGSVKHFDVRVLLETPKEVEYYQHGGILPYVLRQLAREPGPSAAAAA
ncbi:MAG: aconitate hydratase, partial [Xanthomonadales bacterium]|nr:aconitate hydratase [Xanthomonadales bacterium]